VQSRSERIKSPEKRSSIFATYPKPSCLFSLVIFKEGLLGCPEKLFANPEIGK